MYDTGLSKGQPDLGSTIKPATKGLWRSQIFPCACLLIKWIPDGHYGDEVTGPQWDESTWTVQWAVLSLSCQQVYGKISPSTKTWLQPIRLSLPAPN